MKQKDLGLRRWVDQEEKLMAGMDSHVGCCFSILFIPVFALCDDTLAQDFCIALLCCRLVQVVLSV